MLRGGETAAGGAWNADSPNQKTACLQGWGVQETAVRRKADREDETQLSGFDGVWRQGGESLRSGRPPSVCTASHARTRANALSCFLFCVLLAARVFL